MLNVFFTVDVEIWCGGWIDIDRKFPSAFQKYIYGSTCRGSFGLPYQLELLKDHGITGTFFVEPLFSTRFGNQPLDEIIGLINNSGGNQEIQLHLHTEWVDESKEPLLKNIQSKRQHLFFFSLEEQKRLINVGINLLKQAGAGEINSFRAGSFGFNLDTLCALSANNIPFDSSYNATAFGMSSGVMPGVTVLGPTECEDIFEYPMTVFQDGMGSLRHVQLTACSFSEIEDLLWKALEAGYSSFVILSHNFELLNLSKNRPDDIVIKRFKKLCSFLDRNRDSFRSRGFRGLTPIIESKQPELLTMTFQKTGARLLEQLYRRACR